MRGLGLVGLLLAITIGVWVFYAPPNAAAPAQQHIQNMQTIEAAREICVSSAKRAYLADLGIAGINCPINAGVPDVTCVERSTDGGPIYSKFQSAIAGCSN